MYPISLHCKVYADSSKVYQRRLYRFSATQECNLKAAIVHLLFLSLLSMFGVEAKNMCKPKILVNVGSPQHTLYSSRHYTGCHLHHLSCILLNRITTSALCSCSYSCKNGAKSYIHRVIFKVKSRCSWATSFGYILIFLCFLDTP